MNSDHFHVCTTFLTPQFHQSSRMARSCSEAISVIIPDANVTVIYRFSSTNVLNSLQNSANTSLAEKSEQKHHSSNVWLKESKHHVIATSRISPNLYHIRTLTILTTTQHFTSLPEISKLTIPDEVLSI